MSEEILTPGWRRDIKMDRRSRRTRNALTTALMALLKERPLKSITVTELAELADVNRATFYVHFQDVYDMFDQVKEEFCNICRELVDAHGEELARNENRPFLEDIFSYFETNEDAFAIVFGDNADGAFLGDVIDVVRDSCLTAVAPLEAVERRERDQGLTPNRDRALGMALCNYQFDFIAGGIVSMLKSWLASTCAWDRILYGTDWPIVNLGEYIGFIQRLAPERHWEAVFFENANRVYGLGL